MTAISFLYFAHGSFARFFNSANARPARRPSLVAVELSSARDRAARLERGEPAAEAGELIRRQLGNSFGDFFYFHVAQYSTAGAWLSDGRGLVVLISVDRQNRVTLKVANGRRCWRSVASSRGTAGRCAMRFLADWLLTRCAVAAIMMLLCTARVGAHRLALLNDAGRHR